MIKPGKIAVFPVVFLLIFVIFTGLAGNPTDVWAAEQNLLANEAGAAAAGESLDELKAKLWQATSDYELAMVVGAFDTLPGPDPDAAQVLLDYLRDNNTNDAFSIKNILIRLMTDEQVSQLAKDIGAYQEANSIRYLIPVLTERIKNSNDLTSAVLSLRGNCFFDQAWQRIFANPTDMVRWLDETYVKLSDPIAKRRLVDTVGGFAQRQIDNAGRAAVTGWLWRAQENEPDPVYRSDQLCTLYQLGETKALETLGSLYSSLASVRDRAGLIDRIAGIAHWRLAGADREGWIDWLWKIAETDASPYCRQECLAALYMDLGQEKALEQYVRDTDRNGVATLAQEDHAFRIDGLNWRLLRDAGQKYPQSYLGRGIKAYEAVRGIPYFEIERAEEPSYNGVWAPPYGDEEYDPDREIPGWENFLAEFPRHPAADDAAYRLTRCYEIKGRFTDAVKTMQKVRFLPDGDMRYAAAGRLVYILDVRMTYEQLESLSAEKLEPPLQAFVSYSLAIKEVRRENYARAVAGLKEFLKQEEALTADQFILPFDYLNDYDYLSENDKYDFRGSVEKQLAEVKKLAGLQSQWAESKDPADLYQLAAAIFHNEMLYYNHLWAGERQYYNWLGYINETGHGHAPAEMAVFVRDLINYNHSLPYFQQVCQDQSVAPELRAKALYSTGLCYIGLDEWGEDASFAFNSSDIQGKIISTYQQFVKEYPDSNMADDALLALGAYTGDVTYPQRILKEYPESDTVEKANDLIKDLTKGMGSPYHWSTNQSVPFKIMSLDDKSVPREIRNWAAANATRLYTGSKTFGEWSYFCVSAGEKSTAGYSVGIIDIISEGSGKLKVYYRIDNPAPGEVAAQVITHPSVLVRIPATGAAVEFAEGFPQ
ncbi:MAG: hypothetical protein A4E52_00767 [Pelotomaculum sp. PtaB.Bin013]|uniref:Protease complex subunit PrcB family protein n=1 Tax=Pelotomaculum isophthalicicum JI TaxID=947010 RepID=A0A9X4H819_9FIRM|nr:protease complex subunit PrcB family protein [Pelotomaculum isophthalicicum]MDF9408359.1 protease complex subunit PrcB family protein [Pelotomaculum isophthalicicum JI]OPX90658.1 MAG: hypothetical protein A4E52_00767 [Pelotomaculum sp. PtaB.Bin013]